MSVELDPPELGFRRPFTNEVTQLLRLHNPSNDPIAFKVKTTAPKQYCVRPNSGRIDAGHQVEVQGAPAMKEDPPPDARCRDKFLVQTIAIAEGSDSANIATIWQNIEKVSKGSIQERKIRVVFLPADRAATTPTHSNTNGTYPAEDAPPAYGSPSPSLGSPIHNASTPLNQHSNLSPGIQSQAGAFGNTSRHDTDFSSGPATSAQGPSSGNLAAQLAAAKETISKLQREAGEQGLRQRKHDTASQDTRERTMTGSTGTGFQQQPTDGVSVQIVAGLCLLSFLLAYFFF
ncbi:MAG: hypothetical protein LQ342_003779 [Letrouitia transgressa]|nr:MAG: hypothetical protein LQ342_003779 [Letrouitia transgressa]